MQLACAENTALQPVVHDVCADSETFRNLLDRQLFGSFKLSYKNAIPPPDPTDAIDRKSFSTRTHLPLLIELFSDLHIPQALQHELLDACHNMLRAANLIGAGGQ